MKIIQLSSLLKEQSVLQQLQLDTYKYVYAMRVFGFAFPVYIVIYNSKYPDIPMSRKLLKNLKFARVLKYIAVKDKVTKVKIAPPLLFSYIESMLTSTTMLILYDVAGLYMHNKKYYKNIK